MRSPAAAIANNTHRQARQTRKQRSGADEFLAALTPFLAPYRDGERAAEDMATTGSLSPAEASRAPLSPPPPFRKLSRFEPERAG
jgi:hypothetical protein